LDVIEHGDASVTYRQGWEAGHKAGLADAAALATPTEEPTDE
jgi:hypothetical protein